MVKICPEIINLLFITRKVKYYPEKNLAKFLKNLPRKQNLTSPLVQPMADGEYFQ